LLFEVTGGDWTTLRNRRLTTWVAFITLFSPFGITALSALQEFVERGRGTPVPHDPPERLVTTGPYAYIRNPMQMSMTVLLVGFGGLAGSWSIAAASLGAFAFSVGYARVFETGSLATQFGDEWRRYQADVPLFIPRWKPYLTQSATLWVSEDCNQCTQTGRFLMSLGPGSLVREPAEHRPELPTRLTVDNAGGDAWSGMVGIGRVFERVNLAWALLGWMMRLPVFAWFFQLIADASGAGPRVLDATTAEQKSQRFDVGSQCVGGRSSNPTG
jgi:protein-S-isoprenylcysteine O-methyltransferase Ste14